MNQLLITFGKALSFGFRSLNLGNGSTWPGHIALSVNKHFIKDMLAKQKIKVILIAGTNGKTTTSKLVRTIFEKNGKRILHNKSGANLLNGIASTLILNADVSGRLHHDYAIFEIDENALPLILDELHPAYVILLNLFRDQLDRYGEVNTIAQKWQKALQKLPKETTLILDADDPQIAHLGYNLSVKKLYFGIDNKKLGTVKQEHAGDSVYCPNCGTKLSFTTFYFSHLGDWYCPHCKEKRPKIDMTISPFYPLPGLYNQYNTNAAVLLTKQEGINEQNTEKALKNFTPPFGRQEKIVLKGKKIQLFLSKNPTGFNESLRTIKHLGAKHVLLVLNDRIPDGRDISWIWDIDMEEFVDGFENIFISGDRAYDMGLRIHYAEKSQIGNEKFKVIENLKQAIEKALQTTKENQTLYVLPTYSAMLEVRKIIKGKKIL